MRLFELHFRREVREHRRTLLLLAGSTVFLLALQAALFPKGLSLLLSWRWLGALIGVLLVLLTVGGEVFGRELHGGSRFAERLPGGWRASFTGKVLFLALACIGAALFGWLLMNVAALIRGQELRFSLATTPWEFQVFLAPAAALAVMVLAVSTWTPRGSLAFPLGVGLLAIVGWPIWIWAGGPGSYHPSTSELELLTSTLLVGSFVAAALGARLRRFGRGPGLAALATVGTIALAGVPASAWTGHRMVHSSRPHPSSSGFFISSAVLEPSGTSVLCRVEQSFDWEQSPIREHVMRFDLEERNWEWLGADLHYAFAWKTTEEVSGYLLDVENEQAFSLQDGTPWSWPRADLEPCGTGWIRSVRTLEGWRRRVEDPESGASVWLDELTEDGSEYLHELAVRAEGWAIQETYDGPWIRYDVVLGERTELDWPLRADTIVLPDGRVLFWTLEEDDRVQVLLGDPSDASLNPVALVGEETFLFSSAYRARDFDLSCLDFLLYSDDGSVARFTDSPPTLRSLPESESGGFVFCALDDSGTLLVETPDGLEAWNPESGEREALFRKDPAR